MRTFAVLLALATVTAGAVSAATPAINSDSGSSERTWASNANAGTDLVAFVWQPELPIGGTLYVVYGECSRDDDTGLPRGKHKVIFKNLQLQGIDSGNAIGAVTQKEAIKNGVQKNLALWDLTPFRDRFASDSAVLVTGQVLVKKKVAAFDILACDYGVVEIADAARGLETGQARLRHFRELAASGSLGGKLADRTARARAAE